MGIVVLLALGVVALLDVWSERDEWSRELRATIFLFCQEEGHPVAVARCICAYHELEQAGTPEQDLVGSWSIVSADPPEIPGVAEAVETCESIWPLG